VVEADDYGPDVCVEKAAGGPVLDASPLVAEELYGIPAAGWSQQLPVHVEQVENSMPLGPCASEP
jgi:hypothetical protein